MSRGQEKRKDHHNHRQGANQKSHSIPASTNTPFKQSRKSLRKPASPSMSPVITTPEMLGPASMATIAVCKYMMRITQNRSVWDLPQIEERLASGLFSLPWIAKQRSPPASLNRILAINGSRADRCGSSLYRWRTAQT